EEARRETGYSPKPNVTPLKRAFGILLIFELFGGAALILYGTANDRQFFSIAGGIVVLLFILQAFAINALHKRRDPQFRAYVEARDNYLKPVRKREHSMM